MYVYVGAKQKNKTKAIYRHFKLFYECVKKIKCKKYEYYIASTEEHAPWYSERKHCKEKVHCFNSCLSRYLPALCGNQQIVCSLLCLPCKAGTVNGRNITSMRREPSN